MKPGFTTRAATLLFVGALTAGCAPPPPGTRTTAGPTPASGSQLSVPFKRVTAAIHGDPITVNEKVTLASQVNSARGGAELEELVSAGLTRADEEGALHPQLAEAVPSLDNGLWRLLPDGRMEITWGIRAAAQWHDGAPFASEDLLFTAQVVRDRELAAFRDPVYDSIEGVEAPDAQTIMVRWRRPFIDADTLFSRVLAVPLPKHLLETPYTEDKASFIQLPYWSAEFVGAGPYKIRDWVRGSHVVLQANERYALGAPRIHEIELKFIPDMNTLVANVLSGTVELTLGRGMSLEQAVQLGEQWREGKTALTLSGVVQIFPQFISPSPAIVSEVRFRQALLHAIDREQLADSLMAGLVPAAQIFLGANERNYREVETAAVRYAYDPRRAAEMLEALGYLRGADGVLRDAAGQRLALQIWTSDGLDIQTKSIFPIADFWQKIGVAAEPLIIPPQRWTDREYVNRFPAFRLVNQTSALRFLGNLHSSKAPLPENNFVGQNYGRYMNPAFDALIDRFYVTIPREERIQILRQIIRDMTDQVVLLTVLYNASGRVIGNRLQHIPTGVPWNSHEWDIKS